MAVDSLVSAGVVHFFVNGSRLNYQHKISYTLVFISNTSISNARLRLAKNQANAKQHPEAEPKSPKIIRFFHAHYHPKIIGDFSKIIRLVNPTKVEERGRGPMDPYC